MANQAGLDQLDARRKRAERQVPKPHHSKAPVAAVAAEPPVTAVEDLPQKRPVATETTSPAVALATSLVAEAAGVPAAEPVSNRQRTRRFRQTQVLFDARSDAHLNELKKRAAMAEVDLSASGVLRRALDEYVEAHGYDGIVTWFAEHGRQ